MCASLPFIPTRRAPSAVPLAPSLPRSSREAEDASFLGVNPVHSNDYPPLHLRVCAILHRSFPGVEERKPFDKTQLFTAKPPPKPNVWSNLKNVAVRWRGACSKTSSTASSWNTATTLPSRCPPRRACSAPWAGARAAPRIRSGEVRRTAVRKRGRTCQRAPRFVAPAVLFGFIGNLAARDLRVPIDTMLQFRTFATAAS